MTHTPTHRSPNGLPIRFDKRFTLTNERTDELTNDLQDQGSNRHVLNAAEAVDNDLAADYFFANLNREHVLAEAGRQFRGWERVALRMARGRVTKSKQFRAPVEVQIRPAGMTYERALEIAIAVLDKQDERRVAA